MVTKSETGKPGTEKTKPQQDKKTEITKHEPTYSERFTNTVVSQFKANFGDLELTNFQKRLIQNYFISTDMSLKKAEEKRLSKAENYRDPVAITWANINMEALALDVVACAKIGYDPALPNHINMVPYKNKKSGKYDIGGIEGYRGKELKAKKYGYNIPDHVIVEVVYAGDTFIPLKRDFDNPIESYKFKVCDKPFERGEIVGGFYYHSFNDDQGFNKLMFYRIDEIMKRKPEYASVEFWGGEKDKWENNKKVGKEKIEGWFPEMVWKTLYRLAYNSITIDSEKIDENIMRVLQSEREYEETRDFIGTSVVSEKSKKEINQGANQEDIRMTDAEIVEDVKEVKANEPVKNETTDKAGDLSQLGNTAKPGF